MTQPKVQQFESTGFQDLQTAAAETSGNKYYSVGGEVKRRGRKKARGKTFKNYILSFLAGNFY
jgi:hypothetical protein